MISPLFLHSDVIDPYALYDRQLRETPARWDADAGLWVLYSYAHCKEFLNNPSAEIPVVNKNGLNEYALLITNYLTRLSNGLAHAIARQTAGLLFEKMSIAGISGITEQLLNNLGRTIKIDWVNDICKKLPVSIVLKSFGFNSGDSDFIINNIAQLVKIMLPSKNPEQVAGINNVSKDFYFIIEKHLLATSFYEKMISTLTEKYPAKSEVILPLCISNMTGLLIQAYDAGRGLLSNALLQMLSNYPLNAEMLADPMFLQQSVIETLRFDPPVHHTRRIAIADIQIDDAVIRKNQSILIVLAAANRDGAKFENPHCYDINRKNNHEHLSFGAGSHECIAKFFSINMTTQTLFFFLNGYKHIKLIEEEISYEPLSNARLAKNMVLSLIK